MLSKEKIERLLEANVHLHLGFQTKNDYDISCENIIDLLQDNLITISTAISALTLIRSLSDFYYCERGYDE